MTRLGAASGCEPSCEADECSSHSSSEILKSSNPRFISTREDRAVQRLRAEVAHGFDEWIEVEIREGRGQRSLGASA
ncbi:hypothetical protein ACFX1T_043599 [Malus domestica]